MLPDLHELVVWKANALEILHVVNQLLRELALTTGHPATVSKKLSESASLLQEIVVYAFQQVLYPVTKVKLGQNQCFLFKMHF